MLARLSCGAKRLEAHRPPASGGVDTGGALTVEHDIMALKQKASRRQGLDCLRTALDFVDLPTCPALEMVMMGLPGSLIAWRLPRQFHLDEPPFFNESFESAIDRRNP
jgi:hypothetical protein